MTLLRRAPSEAPAPPGPPGAAGAFTDPLTRMLLAGEGLTTPLLEAMLNTRLRVRVLRQEVTGAGTVPAEIAGLLGIGPGEEVLVRRSSLLDPRSSPVSLNHVVGRHRPGDPALDLHTPLGYSVLGRGGSQRRRIVHIGRDVWRRGTKAVPCAVKAYLMLIEGEPAFYVRECFNPAHVSAAVTGNAGGGLAPEPEPGPAAERPNGSASRPGGGTGPSLPPLPPQARHQPAWPDEAELRRCRARLRALPPLTTRDECAALTAELAATVSGDAFLLQMGDCAESFAGCTAAAIRDRQALIALAAGLLGAGTGRPVVTVGRIAGQYGKPRSRPTETVRGPGGTAAEVPSYLGDMVNSIDPAGRTADPRRMVEAYFHAAATLNLLRADPVPRFEAVSALAERAAAPPGHPAAGDLLGDIGQLIAAATARTEGARCLHSMLPALYTSHEALILPYQEELVRRDADGTWWDSSAHLLWAGDRTRHPDEAHVRHLARIANPVAVKLGPSARPEDVTALCRRLNPGRVPGRLTLVTRLGAGRAARLLPPLLRAGRDSGVPVGWVCDPMHANIRTTAAGRKFCRVGDAVAEIRAFFAAHRREGTRPGGLHLETAPEDVTECAGGRQRLEERDLDRAYRTLCDPRLNPAQTVDCVLAALAELRAGERDRAAG
ncbi:3-deoxy-7-phosphoheptulonate synthase [Spirillospora sp. NPDC029432]|uniref:3-deoxy-7-phosphoheptulonate synthase n=1 Tax=Spirillospora sp. NPDC029432 TaxID=3154599 RepID=UPI0034541B63